MLRDLGRLEEALASYEHAILLDPDFADTYYHKGTVLRRLGRVTEAEKYFKKLRAIQAKD